MFKICFDKCVEWYLHISLMDTFTHVVKIMGANTKKCSYQQLFGSCHHFFKHFLQIFLEATSLLAKFQANSISETVGKIGVNIGHLKHLKAQSCEKSCR